MSGVEVDGSCVRKGAVDSILNFLNSPAANSGASRSIQPLLGPDTDVGRRRRSPTASPRPVAHRSPLQRTESCSGWCTSRIS